MKRVLVGLLLAVAALAAQAQVQYREISLFSAAVTATGAAATVDTVPASVGYRTTGGRVLVDCTTVTGTTPSSTFSLQGVVNGVAYTLASATAMTVAGQATFTVAEVPASVRISYVISGTTPSFTCSAILVRQ